MPLPESVQLTPQTHAATLETSTSLLAPRMVGGVPGGVAGGLMGGVLGGVIGGMGRSPAPPPPPRAVSVDEAEVEEAREESEPVAEGNSLGDLFEYKLKERVTIRKNQSALVPILQTDIAAEKVSL